MHGGVHRADHFARGTFAVLAHHGLVDHLRVVNPILRILNIISRRRFLNGLQRNMIPAGVVAVDPDPVHLASASHLVFAYNRDIIFALARDDTRIATHTRAEVDGHAPLVHIALELRTLLIGMLINPALIARVRLEAHLKGELLVLMIFVQRRLAHNRPAFHRPMFLSAGKRIHFRSALQLAANGNVRGIRRADLIGIKPAHWLAFGFAFILEIRNPQLAFATIAQRQRNSIVCHARLHPYGSFHW